MTDEPTKTGFLEEAPGAWSMTRLLALLAGLGAAAVLGACVVVALRDSANSAGIVAALAAASASAFAGAWAALKERT